MTGTSVSPKGSTRHPRHGHPNRKRRINKPNNWEARNGKSRRFRSGGSGQPKSSPVMPAKLLCSVCKEVEDPKYKCPKCRNTYCSIQCCREHKTKGCNASKQNAATTTSKYLPKEEIYPQSATLGAQTDHACRRELPQAPNTDSDDELEEGWKITDAMKEALRKSDWLKKELRDIGLQQIIATINSADSNVIRKNEMKTKQEEQLDLAKENPPFKQFLDKILVLAGVMERHGTDADTNLEEWLKQDMGLGSKRHLTLREQARNTPAKKLMDSKSGEELQKEDDSESSSDDGESESESSSDGTTSEDSDSTSDEDS